MDYMGAMDKTRVVPDQCQPFLRLRSGSEDVVYYSVLYEGLPEEFRIVAEKDLNETDENRKKGMQRLRELIKKEDMDSASDSLLLATLRSSKYNFKKAAVKLRKFMAIRKTVVDQLATADLTKMEKILDDMGIGILPYRDKYGRMIFYSRPYGMNVEEYGIEDVCQAVWAMGLYFLTFPITTVAGMVYFGECDSPSLYLFYPIFKAMRRILPTYLSYPYRVRRVDIINEMPMVRWFAKVMCQILPDKITERVVFHGSGYDNLHKVYDPNMLPNEFGGNLGPLSSKFYKQRVLEFIRELKGEQPRSASSNR